VIEASRRIGVRVVARTIVRDISAPLGAAESRQNEEEAEEPPARPPHDFRGDYRTDSRRVTAFAQMFQPDGRRPDVTSSAQMFAFGKPSAAADTCAVGNDANCNGVPIEG
jgi:hypothetical protein